MWKMIDKSLTLALSKDVISSEERIAVIQETDSYFEKIINWVERLIPAEYKKVYNEKLKNDFLITIYMSSIAQIMLKEDVTFSVAKESAIKEMKENGKDMEKALIILEISDDFKKTIEEVIKEIIEKLMPVLLPIYLKDCQDKLYAMAKFDFNLYSKLSDGNINDVAKILSEAEEIRNCLKQNAVLPIKKILDDFYTEQEAIEKAKEEQELKSISDVISSVFDKIDKARKDRKKEEQYEQIEEIYFKVPLSRVLNIVLNEAVNNDASISDTLKKIDFNYVIKEASDKILNDDYESLINCYPELLKLLNKS